VFYQKYRSTALKRKLNRDAKEIAARAGLSLAEWARRAGVNVSTIKGNINPAQQPKRRGYISSVVTWKLVRAYAGAAGITDEEAYKLLIIEEPDDEQ
jgi:hypothetical protein